jgi:hypothetical protein
MRGHSERGLAFFILLLIGLYLLFRNKFAVSTSVAGVPTPDSTKALTDQNAAYFGFAPENRNIAPYTAGPAPDIAAPSSIGASPFPFSVTQQNTLDTSGLSAQDHSNILEATFHPTIA